MLIEHWAIATTVALGVAGLSAGWSALLMIAILSMLQVVLGCLIAVRWPDKSRPPASSEPPLPTFPLP